MISRIFATFSSVLAVKSHPFLKLENYLKIWLFSHSVIYVGHLLRFKSFCASFPEQVSITSRSRAVHDHQPSQKTTNTRNHFYENIHPSQSEPLSMRILGTLTGKRLLYTLLKANPGTTKTSPLQHQFVVFWVLPRTCRRETIYRDPLSKTTVAWANCVLPSYSQWPPPCLRVDSSHRRWHKNISFQILLTIGKLRRRTRVFDTSRELVYGFSQEGKKPPWMTGRNGKSD